MRTRPNYKLLYSPVLVVLLAGPALADTVLFTFSGTADSATRPFHVDAPWEIQWSLADGSMNIELRSPTDGALVDYYSGNPPGGSAFEPNGGDFFLKISGYKSWTVRVIAIGR